MQTHGIAGVLFLFWAGWVNAGVPIDGDPALLDAVQAGMATTQSHLARGSAHLKITFDAGDSFKTDGDLIWDNGRVYYRHTRIMPPLRAVPKELAFDGPVLVEAVITPEWKFFHYPEREKAGRYGRDKFPKLFLRHQWDPQEIWFRFGFRDFTHDSILDPTSPKKEGRVEKIVVRREKDDRVHLSLVFPMGARTEYWASLAHGGNVVEFRTTPRNDQRDGEDDEDFGRRLVHHGTYAWEQHPSGIWFLKEALFTDAYADKPEQPNARYLMQVSNFSPEVTWKKDRFEFASLDIKPGTGISEITNTGNKSWRHKTAPGDRAPTQQSLDNLGDRLKKQGFSAPQEK